jgi:hypothetical protein
MKMRAMTFLSSVIRRCAPPHAGFHHSRSERAEALRLELK